MCMSFRERFLICLDDVALHVAIYCVVVGRESYHGRLKKVKRVLKMEKIRSPNDAWKGYLKT